MKQILQFAYNDRKLFGSVLNKISAVICFLMLSTVLMAQSGSQYKVTVTLNNVTMEQALNRIIKGSSFGISFTAEDIQNIKNVSVNEKDTPVLEAVQNCLKRYGLTCKVENNTIVVSKPTLVPQNKRIDVRGVVMDESGKSPIVGATVILKSDHRVGAVTNEKGEFILRVPASGNETLVVSYVGMESQDVKIAESQSRFVIKMSVDNIDAGEVYVTGFQTIKKHEMVGSVEKISAEELVIDGFNSIEQALQGKISGLAIQNTSGMVGTRQTARVRGTTTLFGNQEPVWVVDGIIQEDPLPFSASEMENIGDSFDMMRTFIGNSIAWLNPNDIEDITVFKDASATALYGVKAANGVILIKTRRGKSGRTTISYSGNIGTTSKIGYDKLELMNSQERIAVSKEIYERGLTTSSEAPAVGFREALEKYLRREYTYDQFNARVRYLETLNTDWFDLLFTTPITQSHNISVSGGSDKISYYTSLGYNNRKGTARGNNQEGFNMSMSFDYRPHEKVAISARLSGNKSETSSFFDLDPYRYASTTSRTFEVYDENGDYVFYTDKSNRRYNYLNEKENSGSTNKQLSLNTNVSLKWNIIKGLSFESTLSYNVSKADARSYAGEETRYIANLRGYDFGAYTKGDENYSMSRIPHGGILNLDNNENMNYSWRNQLSYAKTFATKHTITAVVGHEVRSSIYDGYRDVKYGYLPKLGHSFAFIPKTTGVDGLTPNGLLDPTSAITNRLTNTLSIYGSISYTFNNKHVINGSVRSDASNKFGQDKRNLFNPVWAAGYRYNISDEKWFQQQKFVSNMSLRVSYGYQGNIAENIGPDLIAKRRIGVFDQYTGRPVLNLEQLPFDDLDWEKTQNLNLGVDFGVWKNKITIGFNYYYKNTTDLIVMKQLPLEYGSAVMPMNGGSLTNQGFDMRFSFSPIKTRDFNWNISFNFSRNLNKLKETTVQNLTWQKATSGSYNKEGYPISGFWAFDYLGVDPSNGLPVFNLNYPEGEDPALDPSIYMKYIGDKTPTINSGFSMSFRYKTLSLTTNFTVMLGGYKFLTPVYNDPVGAPLEYDNINSEAVNRWTPDNRLSLVPGIPSSSTPAGVTLPGHSASILTRLYDMYNYSAQRAAKSSMLRCNSLGLSYTLPKKWIDPLNNIGLSFNVSNPFTIKSRDFKGRDPEVATGLQPIARTYSFGLNISF